MSARSDYLEAHILLASALAYAGRRSDAAKAVEACRRIDPECFRSTEKWRRYRNDERVDYVLDGLRHADLSL